MTHHVNFSVSRYQYKFTLTSLLPFKTHRVVCAHTVAFSCTHGVLLGPHVPLVQLTHALCVLLYWHDGFALHVTLEPEYVLHGTVSSAVKTSNQRLKEAFRRWSKLMPMH